MSLIAHYKLNDNAADTVVADTSGNSRNGVASVNTDTAGFSVAGQINESLDFATTRIVTVANHADFSFGNGLDDSPFSLSVWAFVIDNGTQRILTKWDINSLREWELRFTSTETLRCTLQDEDAAASIAVTSDSSIGLGWRHLVVTYDGSELDTGLKLYVDGQLIDSTPSTTGTYVAMEALGVDVVVGAGLSTGSPITIFNDKIDDVRIYDAVLTTAEITTIYNGGSGTENEDITPPTPNPATFVTPPAAVDTVSIIMTATTGADVTGPVQYLFTETSGNPGGANSSWQASPEYTNSGLDADTQYTYTVTMRDSEEVPNVGTASAPANATTDASSIGLLSGGTYLFESWGF